MAGPERDGGSHPIAGAVFEDEGERCPAGAKARVP
jgi:hypothetical protein